MLLNRSRLSQLKATALALGANILLAGALPACSKSKPKAIAYCVGVTYTAETSATGMVETSTFCKSSKAECETFKEVLDGDIPGKCAPATTVWCAASEECAPTEKRCQMNQQLLNRIAEAGGNERTSMTCRQVNSFPNISRKDAIQTPPSETP